MNKAMLSLSLKILKIKVTEWLNNIDFDDLINNSSINDKISNTNERRSHSNPSDSRKHFDLNTYFNSDHDLNANLKRYLKTKETISIKF